MSSQRRYRELMVELCAAVGIPDPERLDHQGRLTVSDMPVTLLYDEALDADRVFVYVDIAAGRPVTQHDELRQLLAWNLAIDVPTDGVFGVHPDNHQAVLRQEFRLDDFESGGRLASWLIDYVQTAQRWRDRFAAAFNKNSTNQQARAASEVQSTSNDARPTVSRSLRTPPTRM